jgi:hypothetical protein
MQGISELRGKLVRAKLPPAAGVTAFRSQRAVKRPCNNRESSETTVDGICIAAVPYADLTNWQAVGTGKTFPQSQTGS